MKTVFCLLLISFLVAQNSDKKEYNIGITTESGYKDVRSIDDQNDHKTVPNGDMDKMDPNNDVYIMIGDTKKKGSSKEKSKENEKKTNNKGLMVGLFIGFIILVITGCTIGYLYWKQKQNKKNQNKTTKTPVNPFYIYIYNVFHFVLKFIYKM